MSLSPIKIVVMVVISNLAGVIGSLFTFSAVTTWYKDLVKPALNPPGWVFGPVWTLLYVLMGIAAGLVWSKGLDGRGVKIALAVFLFQLVLNALWSIIFFGWHKLGLALVEIVLLWIIILVNIILFYKINSAAGYLLLPYILWVSFAVYLNYSLWRLNSAG